MTEIDRRTKQRIALFAGVGGALWIVLWLFFLATHGLGPENRQETVFGLTWMDFSRFLVIPLAVLGGSVFEILRVDHRRTTTTGGFVTITGFALLTAALIVGRWTLPWGDYSWFEQNQDAPAQFLGGLMMALASLVIAIGSAVLGIGLLRSRVFPWWVAVGILVSGVLLIPWIHETQHGFVYGLLWLVLAVGMRSSTDPRPDAVPVGQN